jgi:hypothetical protein
LGWDTTTRHPFSESDINYDFRNQPERDYQHDAAASGGDIASEASKQTSPRDARDYGDARSSGFAPIFENETFRPNVASLANWRPGRTAKHYSSLT